MPGPTDTTLTGTQIATIRVMTDAGTERIKADSGLGDMFRPQATGEYGSFSANLETLYDFFINNVPDPDSALAQNVNFDEILRQHPDVHMCMSMREKTVANFPLRFEAAKPKGDKDEALCEKIRDYVQERWLAIPNYRLIYEQMQNAVLMGGQGHEFIWQMVEGYPSPVLAQPVHKTRFTFDRLGNMALLTRNDPVWGAYVTTNPQANFPVNGNGKPLNPQFFPKGKFMYHVYSAGTGGNWNRTPDAGYEYYGRGEDTVLYIPVTFDNFVLRFQIKWLEKFGIPLALMYYADGMVSQSQITNICESIRGESTVRIPRPSGIGEEESWFKVDFKEPTGQGYQAFQDFHDRWTAPRISKILLGGANMMEIEAGGYSATVAQKDFGPNSIFRWDGGRISETINNQIIPSMVLARFPGVPMAYMPKHVLEPKEEVDREMQVGILTEVAQAVPVREKDFYDAAGITEPKPEDKTVFLGMSPMGEFDMGGDIPGGGPRQSKSAGRSKDRKAAKAGQQAMSKQGTAVGLGKKR